MHRNSYCDLNIPAGVNCQHVCTKALELGYKILAINTVVVARECLAKVSKGMGKIGKKRKYEKRDSGILTANAVTITNENGVPKPGECNWITDLTQKYPGVRILQRISVIFGDATELQKVLTHQSCLLYDLVAVVPIHHDAVQVCLAAKHLAIDIITFDLEGPYWIKKVTMSRQKGSMAADREIFFEITYSSGLHGDSACENMIYTAHRLLEDVCTKRLKNIVICSGAGKHEELRSPKDMMAFGYLLGLNDTTTTQCIRENSLRIVSNSDGRKHGKTWVTFTSLDTSECLP